MTRIKRDAAFDFCQVGPCLDALGEVGTDKGEKAFIGDDGADRTPGAAHIEA